MHRSTFRANPLVLVLTMTAAAAVCSANAAPASDNTCSVRATGPAPTVVELYTSEGCSSCPPAEAWLNGLSGRQDVLALSFHVTYWDYLGWSDRFAIPEGTNRQRQLARQDGASGVYTPQVRVTGQDWTRWPQLPARPTTPGPTVALTRTADVVVARVDALPGTRRLAGYWTVLEDRHESRVQSGENAGRTLRHDHVVRLYRPVASWPASQSYSSQLSVSPGVPAHPRRVAFVVVDEPTQRPLQAAVLDC
jgi:hypothetical protein